MNLSGYRTRVEYFEDIWFVVNGLLEFDYDKKQVALVGKLVEGIRQEFPQVKWA